MRWIQKRLDVREESLVDSLSDREREILILIGQGFDTRMIGSRLGISPRTVGNHRTGIKNKLRLSNYKEVSQFAWDFIARMGNPMIGE